VAGFDQDTLNVFYGFVERLGDPTTISAPYAGPRLGRARCLRPSTTTACPAGYYIDARGVLHGFIDRGGVFTSVTDIRRACGPGASGLVDDHQRTRLAAQHVPGQRDHCAHG
jgi:hypothetical protein